MAYPQCFPHLASGSQFGPRTFKGKPTHHWGRDQPAGVGSVRYAPAAGFVLAHGRNDTYGHYIVVLYDGARNPESMHQVQARDRWPVGKRFAAGDPLAKVGHPHLWLTEAARRRAADWSGGSKASSTGQHSHQQCWRDRFGGTAIDPAGPEATADWLRVIAYQAPKPVPASTGSNPLTIAQEDDDMIHVHNTAKAGELAGWQGTLAPKFARHLSKSQAGQLAVSRRTNRIVKVNGANELGDLFNLYGISRTLIPIGGKEIYLGGGASTKDVTAAAASVRKAVTDSLAAQLVGVDPTALADAVEVALQGGIVEQVEAGVTNVLRKGTDN